MSVNGQSIKLFITDNQKRFEYSATSGITDSYKSYFGDTLKMPIFYTLEHKKIDRKELEGKTIFYNFWFVKCAPCIAEIPILNQIAKKYNSDSTLFIAITFNLQRDIENFCKTNELLFQKASLTQSIIDSIKKVKFYPLSIIVNKKGIISFAMFSGEIGERGSKDLYNLLDLQMKKIINL